MKELKVITGSRIFKDVVDGSGWTDVDVDGYYDTNKTYVPHQYRSNLKEGSCDNWSTQGNKNTLERDS